MPQVGGAYQIPDGCLFAYIKGMVFSETRGVHEFQYNSKITLIEHLIQKCEQYLNQLSDSESSQINHKVSTIERCFELLSKIDFYGSKKMENDPITRDLELLL